jgi:glutaredoxin 3
MADIIIYTKENCSWCDRATQLLDSRRQKYTLIRVDEDTAKLDEMVRRSGRRTVPQIFINDQPIGGFDDLSALATSGQLDKLLGDPI